MYNNHRMLTVLTKEKQYAKHDQKHFFDFDKIELNFQAYQLDYACILERCSHNYCAISEVIRLLLF